mmetsp:Transcript_127326/g.360278  ORF Transcript_127326/g.360278 Transcript_127326/m.360278 type:complete len:391 (-) Transcript_127326:247-1419(-)
MAGDDIEERRDKWIFTPEALARSHEAARDRAVEALRSAAAEGGEQRPSMPKPLGLEESFRLVLFYAQKIPDLCGLCNAPSEVRWTAVVLYRRFYAVRSSMEYDPLPIMFACVHAACKIEEVREITLDKLLEAADFGADESLKAKVAGLELSLLEGVGFVLLVEPKPDTALRMLSEEARHMPAAPAPQPGQDHRAPAPPLSEAAWAEAVARAEGFALDLAVRTDAVLLRPASILIAGALSAALSTQLGQDGSGAGARASGVIGALLDANLEGEPQRAAVRQMVEAVQGDIRRLASEGEVTENTMKEIARNARRCHRAFERLRDEASEQREAHRKERKRQWSEMKGLARRQVPTPIMQNIADINHRAAEIRGAAAQGDGGEGFVIHRPLEDS